MNRDVLTGEDLTEMWVGLQLRLGAAAERSEVAMLRSWLGWGLEGMKRRGLLACTGNERFI